MRRWRRRITRYVGRLLNAVFVLLAIAVVAYVVNKPEVVSDVLKYFEDTSSSTVSSSGNLKVHYIDVGESDSVLIEENGHFMLIDAGDVDDIGTVLDYLKKQKISQLDYLVLTHPHADHIGSAASVIEKYQVNRIIMPDKSHTTNVYKKTIKAISKKKIPVTRPKVGETFSIGEAVIEILAPNHYNYGDNINNYSIALKIINGKNKFLFIGDCEKEAIADILVNGMNLEADVYMCGHHGSGTSTTKTLLEKVNPQYAVISVGKNSYGHPNKSVINMLKSRKIKIYRTDKKGTIVFFSDGNEITVN